MTVGFVSMRLSVCLPFKVLIDGVSVSRVVVETSAGSMGILPNRLDCVAALVPGILVFGTMSEGDIYCAVDEGVMVKTGADVRVSVRNAVMGTDLSRLRQLVAQEFLALTEQERETRVMLAKLESNFIRGFNGITR